MATTTNAKRTPAIRRRGAARTVDSLAAHRVLRDFRIIFNAVKMHFRNVEKRAGVGGAQIWALSLVRERPGIGITDLARAMDIRQPTASNLVKALAAVKLLKVRRDSEDGRAVALFVRAEGMRILKRTPGPFSGVLPDALATLDAATLARLENDLSKLINVLGADHRGASIPLGRR